MKNLVIIIIALMPFISGCKKDNEADPNMQIREIAWNYLSGQEKSTAIMEWQEASVTQTSFNEVRAYAVTFKTSMDDLLGPITVYVSTSSKVVLGQNLRD